MGLWTADKKPYASAVVPPAPVRILSQKPLAPSFISASDKGDEMIPETCMDLLESDLRLRKITENII